jgi:hypothetical protein
MKPQQLTAGLGLALALVATPVRPAAAQSPSAAEIVLWAAKASTVVGAWTLVSDATAAGGAALWNPDAGATKLTTAAASPASFFELTFTARANTPYRLWLRSRAQNDYWTNDSVFVQFSGSTPAGRRSTASDLSKCAAAPGEIVLWAADAAAPAGAWVIQSDPTAAGGRFVVHPDAGAPKVTTASAAPANYVDVTFDAVAGVPYHLWLRGRAQNDDYGNDSAFVQFSGAVSSTGTPVDGIGTTDAAVVVLEDCSGCGDAGWGWQDNGWGANVMGDNVYFATTGPQRLRIQTREDGYQIDQIVLSPARWLTTSPGSLKNDATILTRSSGP